MKHMKSESNEFETENSRSRVIWLLLYFLFASRAQSHCKTVAPFCLGLWPKSRRMPPKPRKSPWRPLSENHVSRGHCEETVLDSMAQDGILLSGSAAQEDTGCPGSPEERPLLNLTCLHFQ